MIDLFAYKIKVVTLGKYAVGKTSLSRRYARNDFLENQFSTVGAVLVEGIVLMDDLKITIEIWDTAGQEQYESLIEQYWRDAQCTLVVYDITDAESWEKAKSWIDKLQKERKKNPPVIALVGNKADKEDDRVVEETHVKNYVKSLNSKYERNHKELQVQLFLEASAKTGENVKQIFETIAKLVPLPKDVEKLKISDSSLAGFDTPKKSSCC